MKPPLETAVVGDGCFWCVEALMESINGVVSIASGYAGGSTAAPTYRQVCTGTTGHAEVVQVEFDPAVISYADLLHIFMMMHNPTKVNRQGTDKGSQYRSVILYGNEEQAQTARTVINELQAHFDTPIITELLPLKEFNKAEARHQQYYKSDLSKAYCQSVISPKLVTLRNHFLEYLKPIAIP